LAGGKNKRGTVFLGLTTASKLILAASKEHAQEHIQPTPENKLAAKNIHLSETEHARKDPRNNQEQNQEQPPMVDELALSEVAPDEEQTNQNAACSCPPRNKGENKIFLFSARQEQKSSIVPTLGTRSAPNRRTNQNPTPAGSQSQELVPTENYRLRLIYTTGCGVRPIFLARFCAVPKTQNKAMACSWRVPTSSNSPA
jgi:hypothetical protein